LKCGRAEKFAKRAVLDGGLGIGRNEALFI
jgi:hypothetical protein